MYVEKEGTGYPSGIDTLYVWLACRLSLVFECNNGNALLSGLPGLFHTLRFPRNTNALLRLVLFDGVQSFS